MFLVLSIVLLVAAIIVIIMLTRLYFETKSALRSQESAFRSQESLAKSLDKQLKKQMYRYEMLSDKRVKELAKAQEDSNRKIRKLLQKTNGEIADLQSKHADNIKDRDQKYRVLLAQKKSSEVRTGYILEKVAPLFEDFPADLASDTVIPLFDIVDYLIFTDKEVIFCEVKSGDSSLSQRQKRFKQNIKEGRVSYRVFRKKAPEDIENEQKESTV